VITRSLTYVVLLGVAVPASAGNFSYPQSKVGVVMARGLVKGASNQPIFAEYDASGAVTEVIGEAVGDLDGATVMSADSYRQFVSAYTSYVADEGDAAAAGAYVLLRQEYEATNFMTSSGQPIPRPPLLPGTKSVLVRHQSKIVTTFINPVLHQSGIDLRNRMNLGPEVKSVLLSKEGRVLKASRGNIGFRAAYFKPATGDYINDASEDLRFVKRQGDTLWAPVQNSLITMTLDPRFGALSRPNGVYALRYYMPPCPGFQWEFEYKLIASLWYRQYNPKTKTMPGVYYTSLPVWDFCTGLGDSGAIPLPLFLDIMNDVKAIEALLPSVVGGMNITVDVMMLTGQGVIVGEKDFVPIGIDTKYSIAPPMAAPVTSPNALRLERPTLDIANKGLLKEISLADLEKTDIYVFRMSNGQLVTKRSGLKQEEYVPYNLIGTNDNKFFYKMLIRGNRMNDFLTGNLTAYQQKTMINPELYGRDVDFLRPGETVKIIAINRPTGYIGTVTTAVSPESSSGRVDFDLKPLYLLPPNLRVRAERVHEVMAGLTQRTEREDMIGFEGAGLTSDKLVAVTTEWYDHDGTPLPSALEGYTGRMTKVTGLNELGMFGDVAQFDIKPGRHLQLVRLGPASGADHFYIHVSGDPQDKNPDFSPASFDLAGPILAARPRHYVPIMVPVFVPNASIALAAAQATQLVGGWQIGAPAPVLRGVERFYAWPYRPEMQFSVYELDVAKVTTETIFDPDNPTMTSTVSYALSGGDFPQLANIGPEGQMILALGYEEVAAQEGVQNEATFVAGMQIGVAINNLNPADYAALQLYQSNDVANGLWEFYGLPLMVIPYRQAVLTKSTIVGKWDAAATNNGEYDETESYQMFEFQLTEQSDVTVKLLDGAKNELTELVSVKLLPKGPGMFLVTYSQVEDAGIRTRDGVDFWLEVTAESIEASINGVPREQRTLIAGELVQRTEGVMLGQVVHHDVLIQDGSLSLSRSDVMVPGRGPAISLTRSYSNRDSRHDGSFGQGWNHNLDITLHALDYRDGTTPTPGNLPEWVPGLMGEFFRRSDVPEEDPELALVSVSNGGMFKKVNGAWLPQRGQHGRLVEGAGYIDYFTKDGTKYRFGAPQRLPWSTAGMDPVSVIPEDGLVFRLGLPDSYLKMIPAVPDLRGFVPPLPSPCDYAEDRNGNRLTYAYTYLPDERGALTPHTEKVTDAAGRMMQLHYDAQQHIERATVEATGVVVTYTYNADGLLETAGRAGATERYGYVQQAASGNWNLASFSNSNGQVTKYEYMHPDDVPAQLNNYVRNLNPGDVIAAIEYADGGRIRFGYPVADGNKRTVTDARSKITSYTLNAIGNPLRIESPGNRVSTMVWSIDEGQDDNVVLSRTDARNGTTTYEYDEQGNVTTETDAAGRVINMTWHPEFGVMLTRTDRNGHTAENRYDDRGNLTHEIDEEGREIVHTYAANGDRVSTKDKNGNTSTFGYDAYGLLASESAPAGAAGLAVTTYERDARGRLLSVTDPNGNTTTYEYDELDRQTAVRDALGGRSTTRYDQLGNKIREVSNRGLALDYTYDARNRLLAISRPFDGATKTFTYDASSNMLTETDWKGQVTRYEWDDADRQIAVINRAGDRASKTYDAAGNVLTVTDAEGRTTTYEYDELNRKKREINADDGITSFTYDHEGNLLTATDPEGRITTREYDDSYRVVRETDNAGVAALKEYDGNGNLIVDTDREGRAWRYEYDPRGLRTLAIDPLGKEIASEYDLNGNEVESTNERGFTTTIDYDDLNRPIHRVDAEGGETRIEYEPDGAITAKTDELGHRRTTTYDLIGRQLTQVDAVGAVTRYEYDKNDNVTRIVDARNTATINIYDALDRVIRTQGAAGTAVAHETVVTYDKVGNIRSIRDRRGQTTSFEYDVLHRKVRTIDARGGITRLAYDRVGNVLTVTDPRDKTTTTVYDLLNRKSRVTDAADQVTSFTYDRVGNVLTMTDPRNFVTTNTYDDRNRLLTSTKETIQVAGFTYDEAGNVRTERDARGNLTTHTYDRVNRRIRTDYADTTFTETTYDAAGNVRTVVDEMGVTKETRTYDDQNRVQTVTNAANETTRYEYDRAGNKTREVRPKGDDVRYVYDALGRVIEVRDAVGVARFENDAAGNVTAQIDANGNRTEFRFDELGRRTHIIQVRAAGNLTTQFEYDPTGNLTAIIDAAGQRVSVTYDNVNRELTRTYPTLAAVVRAPRRTVRTYDAAGNVTRVEEVDASTAGTDLTDETTFVYDPFNRPTSWTARGKTVAATYDALGNRTRLATGGTATVYTYDLRNRLKTVTAEGDTAGTTYTYRPDGVLGSVTYPEFEAVYDYDDADRVTEIVNQIPGAPPTLISSVTYAYDANGNPRQRIEAQPGMAVETTDYTYDNANRLTAFTSVAGGVTSGATYVYDAAGNRTQEIIDNGGATITRTYSYDQANRLTRITQGAGGVDLTYDANGNIVSKSDDRAGPAVSTLYDYDVRDQLVRVQRGPAGSEIVRGRYDYDYAGKRTRHLGSARGDIAAFWDGRQLLEERRVSDDALVAHYRNGLGVVRMDAGGAFYFAKDAQGSTMNVVGAGGVADASYRLDPWGRIKEVTGGETSDNATIFTGRQWDEQAGLHYLGQRYYDPELGRFLSQDSVLGTAGSPIAFNRYVYGGDNPALYVDPDGDFFWIPFLVSGLIGAAINITLGWVGEKFIDGGLKTKDAAGNDILKERTLAEYAFSKEGAVDFVLGFAGPLLGAGHKAHLTKQIASKFNLPKVAASRLAGNIPMSGSMQVLGDIAVGVGGDWLKKWMNGQEYGFYDPMAATGVHDDLMTSVGISGAGHYIGRGVMAGIGKIGSAIMGKLKGHAQPKITGESPSPARPQAETPGSSLVNDGAVGSSAGNSAARSATDAAAERAARNQEVANIMKGLEGRSDLPADARSRVQQLMKQGIDLPQRPPPTKPDFEPAPFPTKPTSQYMPDQRPTDFVKNAENMTMYRGHLPGEMQARTNSADIIQVDNIARPNQAYVPMSTDPNIALYYAQKRVLEGGANRAFVTEIVPRKHAPVIDWRTSGYGGKEAESEFRMLRNVVQSEQKRQWAVEKGPGFNPDYPFDASGWNVFQVLAK
jgi:RHS repeat-associated protein